MQYQTIIDPIQKKYMSHFHPYSNEKKLKVQLVLQTITKYYYQGVFLTPPSTLKKCNQKSNLVTTKATLQLAELFESFSFYHFLDKYLLRLEYHFSSLKNNMSKVIFWGKFYKKNLCHVILMKILHRIIHNCVLYLFSYSSLRRQYFPQMHFLHL